MGVRQAQPGQSPDNHRYKPFTLTFLHNQHHRLKSRVSGCVVVLVVVNSLSGGC